MAVTLLDDLLELVGLLLTLGWGLQCLFHLNFRVKLLVLEQRLHLADSVGIKLQIPSAGTVAPLLKSLLSFDKLVAGASCRHARLAQLRVGQASFRARFEGCLSVHSFP